MLYSDVIHITYTKYYIQMIWIKALVRHTNWFTYITNIYRLLYSEQSDAFISLTMIVYVRALVVCLCVCGYASWCARPCVCVFGSVCVYARAVSVCVCMCTRCVWVCVCGCVRVSVCVYACARVFFFTRVRHIIEKMLY